MAAADQKLWRLYQFDFMGLRNTTDIIKTTAGTEILQKHKSVEMMRVALEQSIII